MGATTDADGREASHLTGDYYWLDDVPARRWWAAAVLCVVLPPVGLFYVAFFAFKCLKTESDLEAADA
jgi:hypothetical protein